jgi:hypothetical protein
MGVYGGWQGKVYAYHQVSGTPLLVCTGAGANQSAGTAYEMVDDLTTPTLTLTEADVAIYNETGAALLLSTNFDINTDSKGVTIKAAYNAGGVSGNVLTVSYKAREQCVYAQGVDFKLEHGLIQVYGIGSRNPLDIIDGPIKVSGSCKQFYNTSTFAYLASESGGLKPMTFDLWLDGNTSYQMRVYEAKFTGYDMDLKPDAVLSEAVAFTGKFYSSSGG